MDNSVDEALAGEADDVEIVIHPDNSVTVTDNGRGIPVDIMEKEKRPAAEVVLTVLHAGGKFGDGGGYKVSGGLHGVGVSVVNALSERLDLTVWRDGHEWTQSLRARQPDGRADEGREDRPRGTRITFLPDLEIFETIDYDRTVLEQRFREMAFLTKGLKIDFTDERGERFKTTFQYDGGIVDFVSIPAQPGTREPLHPRSSTSRDSSEIVEVRSRCSGTTRTKRRCSRSPTTSTRTRAGRTSPASARRSREPSTPMPARPASSRRRT
jgi:DNA gyrase subunit B